MGVQKQSAVLLPQDSPVHLFVMLLLQVALFPVVSPAFGVVVNLELLLFAAAHCSFDTVHTGLGQLEVQGGGPLSSLQQPKLPAEFVQAGSEKRLNPPEQFESVPLHW